MNIASIFRHYSHPSIYFPAANCCAFAQSGDPAALGVAVATFGASAAAHTQALFPDSRVSLLYSSFLKNPSVPQVVRDLASPLGIVAVGTLMAAMFSLGAGAVLPFMAGLFFAIGNYCNASDKIVQYQHEGDNALLKTASNAAVYYGAGYACIGLLAGGFDTMAAGIATTLGVAVTSLAAIGSLTRSFTSPSAPFIAVAAGTVINSVAGILTGNWAGAFNNLLAAGGELSLAYSFEKEHQRREDAAAAVPDKPSFADALSKPARWMTRSF